jgi:hypothetical protein
VSDRRNMSKGLWVTRVDDSGTRFVQAFVLGRIPHVTREASSEAKASSMRGAFVGGCRIVVVAGERRIRSRGARSEPRNNFR